MRRFFPVAWLLTFSLMGNTWSQAAQPLAITCPAVEADNASQGVYRNDAQLPVAVVVMGRIEASAGNRVYELAIERSIYGAVEAKTILVAYPDEISIGKRMIFALSPADAQRRDRATFEIKYTAPPNEEAAQAALGRARRDFYALSAGAIVVGEEVGGISGQRKVRVEKVLSGKAIKPGDTLEFSSRAARAQTGRNASVANKRILFFDVHQYDSEPPRLSLTSYLPVSDLAEVEAVIKRPELHPAFAAGYDAGSGRYLKARREIMFRGTPTEALDLLGAESEAAVTLGRQYLKHRAAKARPAIVAAIRDDLLLEPEGDTRPMQRLKNLVALLAELERDRPGDALSTLTGELLAKIEQREWAPLEPSRHTSQRYTRTSGGYAYGEERADANHCLSWLVSGLDAQLAQRQFGPRLLSLRKTAGEDWRGELQLALDAAGIEDSLELQMAAERMRGVKPLHAAGPRLQHHCELVRFSDDGRLLATLGYQNVIHLWNTADWSLHRSVHFVGFCKDFAIAADNRSVLVAGGEMTGNLARYSLDASHPRRDLGGHDEMIDRLWASRDNARGVTYSDGDQRVHVWDLPAGKIVQSHAADKQAPLAVSPDGKLIVWHRDKALGIESLDDGRPIGEVPLKGKRALAQFTADGKQLVLVERELPKSALRISVLDLAKSLSPVTSKDFDGFDGEVLSVSPSGLVAVVGKRLLVASIQKDLADARFAEFQLEFDARSASFSPDGKWLAIGHNSKSPRIVATSSLEQVVTHPPEAELAQSLCFSDDGQTLRTRHGNTVARWDTATLKLQGRTTVPADRVVLSIEPTAGRYLLARTTVTGSASTKPSALQVLDADTGNVVADIESSDRWQLNRDVYEVAWLSSSEAAIRLDRWVRFNFLTGKLNSPSDARRVDPRRQRGRTDAHHFPSEDGANLFVIERDNREHKVNLSQLDLATGNGGLLGRLQVDNMPTALGLGPNGKEFFLADAQGLRTYDRSSLEPIASKTFSNTAIRGVSFSSDGRRYALVVDQRTHTGTDAQNAEAYDGPGLVRIHNAATGATLFAFPAPTGNATIRFSPQGNQLAIGGNDGVWLWKLPEIKTAAP